MSERATPLNGTGSAQPTVGNAPLPDATLLETLIKHSPVGVTLVDRDFRYLLINEQLAAINGFPVEYHLGRTVAEVVPHVWPKLEPLYRHVIETGTPISNIEISGVVPSQPGRMRHWTVSCYPVRQSPDEMLGVGVMVLEITERKRAEDALAVSEMRLRAILDSEPECVKLLGPDYLVLEMNPAGLAMIDADSEKKIVGRDVCPLIVPEHRPAFRQLVDDAFQGKAGNLEFELEGLKGRRLWLHTHSTPFRDSQGRIVAALSVTNDITHRKKLEEQLQTSRTMLESILNTIPIGVFWKNRDGKYLGCNSVVARSFGMTNPQEITGKDDFELPGLTREQAEFFILKDRHVMESNQPEYGIVERATLADGSTIWMDTSKIPLRNTGGDVIGILGTWQNITERRKLEEQLRQSQKMEAVGQLAGGVAHDFNNLLTVITGYSELLLSMISGEHEMWDFLVQIRQASEKAAMLTRQLLAFSRRSVLDPRLIDLNAAVHESEKMLGRLLGEEVRLSTELEPNLDRIRVDPGHLHQVIMNLVVNARDAMPEGGKILIRTANVEWKPRDLDPVSEVKPGRYVRLSVSDTGTGMAPDVLAHVFEPFFTTKGPGKGTGLGLSVVHGIIKQSGGHLEVKSELGQGTTFQIDLPAATDANKTEKSSERRQPIARGTETILLVEDEHAVRALTQRALQEFGYRVLAAAHGPEALEIADRHAGKIDLMLTDVIMPDMGGRKVAEILQSRYPHIKVIYCSGYTDDDIVRRGVLQEDVPYLQKPFTLAALSHKIRAVLDRR